MPPYVARYTQASMVAFTLLAAAACRPVDASPARAVPAPALQPEALPAGLDTAVFAGGCFWGVEAVFRHTKGVISAVSGYAGGTTVAPGYEQVSSGDTGHAESVQVIFDPKVVPYGTLLQVFFSVAHDPTELNRQGPDVGTQYRSAIFTRSGRQAEAAKAYIAQLTAAKTFARPIVTELSPLKAFYPAEAYHQNYLALHPTQAYIVYNDLPKLAALKREHAALYRDDGIAAER
jgi:peptide-methionine (S)-S-oxide reductase